MNRVGRAWRDGEALLSDSRALVAEAAQARRQSVFLKQEAERRRFQHAQLARSYAVRRARLEQAAERRIDRTFPSAWSSLRFRAVPGDLESVLLAVGSEIESAPATSWKPPASEPGLSRLDKR